VAARDLDGAARKGLSAAVAVGVAWFLRKRETEPEDVTIGSAAAH
jgi:hypothetical protein